MGIILVSPHHLCSVTCCSCWSLASYKGVISWLSITVTYRELCSCYKHAYNKNITSYNWQFIQWTRPDIPQAVGLTSSSVQSQQKTAAKRIIHYLKGTFDMALRYKKGDKINQIFRYWFCRRPGRLMLNKRLCVLHELVSWSSKKQPIVTHLLLKLTMLPQVMLLRKLPGFNVYFYDFHVLLLKSIILW